MRRTASRLLGAFAALAVSLAAVRAGREVRGRSALARYRDLAKSEAVAAPDESRRLFARGERLLLGAIAAGAPPAEARTALALERIDEAERLFATGAGSGADRRNGPNETADGAGSRGSRSPAGVAAPADPAGPARGSAGRVTERSGGGMDSGTHGSRAAVVETRSIDATDGVSPRIGATLAEASIEIREALRSCPAYTPAWLAGYRLVQAARVTGHAEILESLVDPRRAAASGGGDDEPSERVALAAGRAFLQGAIRSAPFDSVQRRAVAALLVAAGRREEALEHYRAAIGLPGVDAFALLREMLDRGYSAETVLAAAPERYETRLAAGQALWAGGFPAEAETAYLSAAALSPAAIEPRLALARIADGQGRHEEALTRARAALDLAANQAPALRAELLVTAALASAGLGDRAGALSFANRALETNPGLLWAHDLIAGLLLQQGDSIGAIGHWQTLLSDHAEDAWVRQNAGRLNRSIGESYEKMGESGKATRSFLAALDADPNDPRAREALKRLASGQGAP